MNATFSELAKKKREEGREEGKGREGGKEKG